MTQDLTIIAESALRCGGVHRGRILELEADGGQGEYHGKTRRYMPLMRPPRLQVQVAVADLGDSRALSGGRRTRGGSEARGAR